MARPPVSRPTEQEQYTKLLTDLDARIQSLYDVRLSWWYHWRELANFILPRRMRWLYDTQSPGNTWTKGVPLNQNIINNTATLAARTLAAGMLAGTTSPGKPWFRLVPANDAVAEDRDVKVWLEEARSRMMRVMGASNYYTSKGVQLFDEVVFGTSPMIIYEHPDKIVHCYVPTPGEYFLSANGDYEIDGLYRRYPLSIGQIVNTFGLANCPDNIRTVYETGGGALAQETTIAHALEPNPAYSLSGGTGVDTFGVPKMFRYREIYWVYGNSGQKPLRVAGYEDKPFSALRWDVFGNDAYGRSPGMDALGDTKQLQFQEKRKAQAIDKQVRPPMLADAGMKNEPASLLPGAITYVPQLSNGVGFRPVYQVQPNLRDMKEDMQGVEQRIKEAFFTPLFSMFSNLDTVRTATEIDARQQEKLLLLGPVLQRNDVEGLGPDIKRIFNICARRGVFPPLPDALAGAGLRVEYVSMLSELQRGSATAAIERTFQVAGNLVGVIPNIMDNIDGDLGLREYGSLLRVDPRVFRALEDTAAIRQARSEAEQAAAGLQTGMVAAAGAKTLSETELGGGQNALAALLGRV